MSRGCGTGLGLGIWSLDFLKMPHTMPFAGQENKWFTILIIISLPFYVLFRLLKGDLPDIKDINSNS